MLPPQAWETREKWQTLKVTFSFFFWERTVSVALCKALANGRWHSGQDGMETMLTTYYKWFFNWRKKKKKETCLKAVDQRSTPAPPSTCPQSLTSHLLGNHVHWDASPARKHQGLPASHCQVLNPECLSAAPCSLKWFAQL